MAVLLVVSGLATTAFAAGERSEIYMVSFPRDAEANKANWDRDDLQFMNGWHMDAYDMFGTFAVGSYDGKIAYCIEPGVPIDNGYSLTAKDETFWDNYPSAYNKTIDRDTIKSLIGRILQYGYNGTIDPNWVSQNAAGAEKLAHVYATQLLIWETIVGERDENFGHVSTGGKNAVLDFIKPGHPLRSRIMDKYNSMVTSVQNHSKVPSFMAKSKGKAPTMELEWDGTQYTATLNDTNKVLGNYNFSSDYAGLKFTTSGNTLTITSTTAPTGEVTINASKKDSKRMGMVVWDDGAFGPNGGQQNTVTYTQSVTDPIAAYVKLKVSYGSVEIIKTSEDGNVDGLDFRVQGENVDDVFTTADSGHIQIDNLMPGVYTVTEQSSDEYNPQDSQEVTVVAGQTATVTFNNTLRRGDLAVTKTAEDGLTDGMKFHLYGTSLSGLAVDEYATVGADGKAYFKNILIGTGYTLEEVDTPERYVIPESQTATVEWNTVTEKSFDNRLKKWSLTVTKRDGENGTPQGNASLAGAVYGIYNGEELVDTYTTNANGQFTTQYYPCGDNWSLREIKPSEGYLLDESTHHIGAEAKNYEGEYSAIADTVDETVKKGNIALIKHTDNGDTQLETPEVGAEFDVYLKSSGSYDATKDTERDHLVCDENGFTQTKMLPYGIYTVHQTKGWDGRELLADFDVYIAEDGQTYRYLANNANFESFIKITKVDAETGKAIPYAGAGFQLYRPDGTLIAQSFTYPTPTTIDTFYTNDEGWLLTPETLEYGTGYSLVEVQAPYGYVLNSEPVYFDVTVDNASQENAINIVKVTKENVAQKGVIKVGKTGGELRLTIMATLAQEESRKISERVRAGQKISRDNGVLYGNGNIIGYDRVGDTYVINKDQAETVRMIFDLYLDGLGETKICKELCRRQRKDGHGNVSWSVSKISRILRNATYMGYKCYYKSCSNNYLEQKRIKNLDESSYLYIKGDFEPIIPEEIFRRCEEIRKSRTTKMVVNQGERTYGKRASQDVWLRKLRCKCGSTFRKNKWRTNKRGDTVYGYQCYNQVNNGSKTFREKNGLDVDGYCDIRMIGDWKLDLMAKMIFQTLWTDKKAAVLEAYRLLQECFQSDTSNNKAAVAAIQGKIARAKERMDNLISMRADGEISKEQFQDLRQKAESDLAALNEELERINAAGEESDNSLNMSAIEAALNEMLDFSGPTIDEKVLDKFVCRITPLDDTHFRWDLNLAPGPKQAIIGQVEGRKNKSTVQNRVGGR